MGLAPRNLWKRSYARSQGIPRIRTMAVVSDNPRSNTKRGNKGPCSAKESALLLLRLVFTHGEDLLQDFLDIFIHLALGNPHRRHASEYCLLHGPFSPGEQRWLRQVIPPKCSQECQCYPVSHFHDKSRRVPCFSFGGWLSLLKSAVLVVNVSLARREAKHGRAKGSEDTGITTKGGLGLLDRERHRHLSKRQYSLSAHTESTISRQGTGC